MDPQLKDWLEVELADAQATGTFHLAGYQTAVDSLSVRRRCLRADLPRRSLPVRGSGGPQHRNAGGRLRPLRRHSRHVAGDRLRIGRAPWRCRGHGRGGCRSASRSRARLEERLEQQELAHRAFDFAPYVQHLLSLALPGLQKVSVAVPNYNYARFMADRLGSIFRQSYPVHEVIVLDD